MKNEIELNRVAELILVLNHTLNNTLMARPTS